MEKHALQLEKFQGPLDLLMHLLEKRKIDIYDIPIAEIADQYMEYIHAWEEYNIEVASEFLVMAATLLQIKSRLLLPRPVPPENSEDDPRQELVDKLLEYQRIKHCAGALNDRQSSLTQIFVRKGAEGLFEEVQQLPDRISFSLLLDAFRKVMESAESGEDAAVAEIQREEISVKRKMIEIFHYIKHAARAVHFPELLRKNSRTEIVACFLALLELVRIGRLKAVQDGLSREILLYIRKGDDVQEQPDS